MTTAHIVNVELKKKFVMIYVSRITDIKNKNLVNNINNMIQQH
jgi:hypothetical protein